MSSLTRTSTRMFCATKPSVPKGSRNDLHSSSSPYDGESKTLKDAASRYQEVLRGLGTSSDEGHLTPTLENVVLMVDDDTDESLHIDTNYNYTVSIKQQLEQQK